MNFRLSKLKTIFPAWNSIFITQPLFNTGFYGLKSIFILFIISKYSLAEGNAISIYATFMALCYATPLIGGYVADHGLGVKNAALIGGCLALSGLSCLFFQWQELSFLGFSLICLGSGLFKPSLLTAIGLIFENPKDPRKDTTYSVLYVIKNVGTVTFPPLCGFIGRLYGWPFSISLIIGIFMIGTFLVFKTMRLHTPNQFKERSLFQGKIWVFTPLLVCTLYILFKFRDSFHGLMGIIAIGSAIYFGKLIHKSQGQDRKDALSILGYIVIFSLFCALVEQLGSSLLLYFDKLVDRTIIGITLPSSTLMSFNPLILIICGPFVLFLFNRYFEKVQPIPGFIKIGVGFLFVALSFSVWALSTFHQEGSPIPLWWVFGAVFFQTMGELLVVPITTSKVSQLSSPQNRNIMMGFWTMAIAYGHYIAGGIAQLSIRSNILHENIFAHYREFFSSLAMMALAIGLFVLSYSWFRGLYLKDKRSE